MQTEAELAWWACWGQNTAIRRINKCGGPFRHWGALDGGSQREVPCFQGNHDTRGTGPTEQGPAFSQLRFPAVVRELRKSPRGSWGLLRPLQSPGSVGSCGFGACREVHDHWQRMRPDTGARRQADRWWSPSSTIYSLCGKSFGQTLSLSLPIHRGVKKGAAFLGSLGNHLSPLPHPGR